jgi:hypothetical protein
MSLPADRRTSPDGAQPVGDTDARKERVLHTRVPGLLDRQLKQRARSLGMSVSTVVRHVLLNTFGLVEDIVADGTNVALAITGQEPSPPATRAAERARADEVLGWQEAVLNVNAVCADCNAILKRGVRAAIGIRDQPGPRTIICRRCLDVVEERAERRPGAKR